MDANRHHSLSGRRLSPALLSLVPLLVVVGLVWSVPAATGEELSSELEPFAYRLGNWTAAVEFLDAEGAVTQVVPSLREVTTAFGGRALQERGRLFGEGIEVVSMIFVDASGRVTELAISSSGRVDYLYPSFDEGQVVFSHDLSEGRGEVLFRAIDSDFEEHRYRTTGWISRDGGETWRQTFRQANYRTDLPVDATR